MEDQPNAQTLDVRGNFHTVANAMRELADRLTFFCSDPEQVRLSVLSGELKQIGWNSLFVSSTIDNLSRLTMIGTRPFVNESVSEVKRQIDSLLVAVNYLNRSVKSLKSERVNLNNSLEEVDEAFQCLAEKLGEVIGECQRS